MHVFSRLLNHGNRCRSFLATLLTAALMILHAGCGKSEPRGGSASDAPAAQGKVKTIGVAFETLQTEGWVAAWDRIKEESQKNGITMLEAVADGDANKQFEQVRNFINRKVDGIIIAPKDSKR